MNNPLTDTGVAFFDFASYFSQYGALDSSLFAQPNAYGNRVSQSGADVENAIQMGYCNCLASQQYTHPGAFMSHLGSANNPPDFILANGCAVEVKKTSSISGEIQLNSSPVKREINIETATRAVADVLQQEARESAPLFYCFALMDGSFICKVAFIEGALLDAADSQNMFGTASAGVQQAFADTDYDYLNSKEIARIQSAQGVFKTTLRVRPMWTITNPFSPAMGLVSGQRNVIEVVALATPSSFNLWNSRAQIESPANPITVTEHPWLNGVAVKAYYGRQAPGVQS
jgi:hypothetical protein